MAKNKKSVKQLQIDKANARIVLTVSLALAVAAFSVVAIKSLLSQQAYQARVISKENKALVVANADVKAASELSASYSNFDSQQVNIIKGNKIVVGPAPSDPTAFTQDGTNSKIVLDALPSKYDFPALISSLESVLKRGGFKVNALTGSDDITQATDTSSTSPQPVPMPFQFSVTGSYQSIQDLMTTLDRSIRPIAVTNMQLSGGESNVSLVVSANTYYQPGKTFKIDTQVVKWNKKI